MWKIKQIFDGDYGCEELAPGAKPKAVAEEYKAMLRKALGRRSDTEK